MPRKKKKETEEEVFNFDGEGAEIMEKDDDKDNDADIDTDFSDLYGSDFIGDGDSENNTLNKHQDLLKELTSFSSYIKQVVNNWLGLVWNEEEEKYMRDADLEPVLNKRGASWCIGLLKTYTRSNNIITNISQDHYNFIMEDIIDTVWMNLGTRDKLGVKNDGDLKRICVELEHASALILMGAGDGKYNRLLSTTVNRTETLSLGREGQKTSNEEQQSFLTTLKKQ